MKFKVTLKYLDIGQKGYDRAEYESLNACWLTCLIQWQQFIKDGTYTVIEKIERIDLE